jgi:pimeloyl-ACP methyl ester carboxylesterase
MVARGEKALEGPSLVGQLLEEFVPFAPASGPLPDPTPAEGPDPYGNPDPEWMRLDWRDHLRRVAVAPQLDGERPTEVNYVDLPPLDPKSATTVLFIHGLSGSWQNWLENLPHFARTHRVVALDLPGFGHSPLPPWPI